MSYILVYMTACEGFWSWSEVKQNVYSLVQCLKLRFAYTTSFHTASDGNFATARKWLVSKQTIFFYGAIPILLQAIYLKISQVISLNNGDLFTTFAQYIAYDFTVLILWIVWKYMRTMNIDLCFGSELCGQWTETLSRRFGVKLCTSVVKPNYFTYKCGILRSGMWHTNGKELKRLPGSIVHKTAGLFTT